MSHVRYKNICIRGICDTNVLAGATAGAQVLSRLIELLGSPTQLTVVYLDFSAVDVATSSFLRECVVGFRNYCRRSRPEAYPVPANLNSEVSEELGDLMRSMNDAFVCCDLTNGGIATDPIVLGRLDEKQLVALNAIAERGEATAKELRNTEDVGTTAWNNRLVSLADKGLLIERKIGRTNKYSLVLEGLNYGP